MTRRSPPDPEPREPNPGAPDDERESDIMSVTRTLASAVFALFAVAVAAALLASIV
jgi:hypothetical protein